ncbi:phosphoadenosine phosphosulfate reductase [Enemella dayhoffiae]|uniref:Adenosine 5'-phosphosulfate reductase n=1 Tax=Enemella dayhoffiae TaxID=2016507 RepID=A0A255H4C8_9ACTN|nr:phosphoadenylyl-sulfate reductase [Enemella dayhoffiae]OYO21913.1 phosphoadenosine phosphosulfate reductase [Enemella dayhoffiae]
MSTDTGISLPSKDPAEVSRLQQLAAQGAHELVDASAEEVIAWGGRAFGDGLAVACSMAADTVLAHLAAQVLPGVDVLFLDTGYHFEQTYDTRTELADALPITLIDITPRRTVAEQDAEHGPRLHDRDPALCCQLRKVEPLDRTLAGYRAWVTGVRREDNTLRANAQHVEWDARHQLVKLNPIAGWSFDQVIDYAQTNGVPVNPLLADGYPSIGCAPCTRRVAPGEDPRAGRWAGLAKTECGIHL